MELPESVLAFKLLDGACLQHKDRQLVLTGVNYAEVANMFKQMKTALKKFFGEQSIPVSADDNGIKVHQCFILVKIDIRLVGIVVPISFDIIIQKIWVR